MSLFVLLPRNDGDPFAGLTPAEIQVILGKYMAWTGKLRSADKLRMGHKLRDGDGRVLNGTNGKLAITDGPFCEAKEVVGGIWIIEAADYEEAVALSRDCPHLAIGSLEIRAVEPVRE
ncbi:MAG: transcription initiation protein [Gemmatimonadales bacterium]|nr:transcription initiation protein [Gemmatimonadales bacterium]